MYEPARLLVSSLQILRLAEYHSKNKKVLENLDLPLPKNIPVIRSLIDNARCVDCSSERIVLLSTDNLKTNIHLAKCIDCGAMGVLSESREIQDHLVIFVNMLEQWDCLKYENPTELIEFYQKAKELQKHVN